MLQSSCEFSLFSLKLHHSGRNVTAIYCSYQILLQYKLNTLDNQTITLDLAGIVGI